MRKVPSTSSGSGMQYRPRDTVPSGLEPPSIPQFSATSTETSTGQKRRSQPFRRVPPRRGVTFPMGSSSSSIGNGIGPTGPSSQAPGSALGQVLPQNAHGRASEAPVQIAWDGTPSVQGLLNETDFEAFFAPPALD